MMAQGTRWERRLDELVTEYGVPADGVEALRRLLALLEHDRHAPTPIRAPAEAIDAHVADSLTGLVVPAVRTARTLADLGSGAGFPGLVLAAARPRADVVLVESVGRKAGWLRGAVGTMGLPRVRVAAMRAEEWAEAPVDAVTARALAGLPVLVEYAAPLLREGGVFVAWKGAPDRREEADGCAAAAALGLEETGIVRVIPFPAARARRLYVYTKVRETPPGYPRRPGMALKRPRRATGEP